MVGVQSWRLHLSQGRCWQRNVYCKKRSFISGGWRWYYCVGNARCWLSIWRGVSVRNCRKPYWKSPNSECSFIRYVSSLFFIFFIARILSILASILTRVSLHYNLCQQRTAALKVIMHTVHTKMWFEFFLWNLFKLTST